MQRRGCAPPLRTPENFCQSAKGCPPFARPKVVIEAWSTFLKLKSGLNLKKSMLLAMICLTTAFLGVPPQSSDTDWLAFC